MLFPSSAFFTSLVVATAAKELAKDAEKAAKFYDSGITHQQIMNNKEVCLNEDFTGSFYVLTKRRRHGLDNEKQVPLSRRNILPLITQPAWMVKQRLFPVMP